MLPSLVIRKLSSRQLMALYSLYTYISKFGAEFWVGFGSGKVYTDIPVHKVSFRLGPHKCKAIPFFNGFTDCDLTSSILGIGNKSGWNASMKFPEVTETMLSSIKISTRADRGFSSHAAH